VFFAVLLIRVVYPGSRIRIFSIPDPGSKRFPDPESENPHPHERILVLKTEKIFVALGNMIRDVHSGSVSSILIFYPSQIPEPGVKRAPDPGSGYATLVL
jgi:hypothetical protein